MEVENRFVDNFTISLVVRCYQLWLHYIKYIKHISLFIDLFIYGCSFRNKRCFLFCFFFIFNRNQKSSKQNPILQIVTQRHHHHRRSALRENPSHPNVAVHLQHPIYPLKRRNQTIMKIASKRKIVINMAKHPHRGQVNVVEIVLIAMKSRSSILSLPT